MSDTRTAILEHLVHEADLEGIAIVTQQELAELIGVSRSTICIQLASLVESGHLSEVGRSKGVKHKPVKAFQIREDLL